MDSQNTLQIFLHFLYKCVFLSKVKGNNKLLDIVSSTRQHFCFSTIFVQKVSVISQMRL